MERDHDVITAMAVLALPRTAEIEDVRWLYSGAPMAEGQAEAQLEILQKAPAAFIALLSEPNRTKFVEHVRAKFVQDIELQEQTC